MNAAMPVNIKKPTVTSIEDVQGHADSRQIPINKVGIKDIFHPVRVKDRARGEQHTVANIKMYVNLPHNFKGTHMSRFVEILNRQQREISVESFGSMLGEMTERLAATSGHIEMSFPYFVMKKAPVSGVESLMNYQATIFGEFNEGKTEVWLKVVVPTTSLCPCSKEISDYGAHNQRSHITLTARLTEHSVARGVDRDCRARGLVRGVRHVEAPRREVRDRTCL